MGLGIDAVLTRGDTTRTAGFFPKKQALIEQTPLIFTRGIEIKIATSWLKGLDDIIVSQIQAAQSILVGIAHDILRMYCRWRQKTVVPATSLF